MLGLQALPRELSLLVHAGPLITSLSGIDRLWCAGVPVDFLLGDFSPG